jgi:uncharacterized protein YbaA (DUF1428 family)
MARYVDGFLIPIPKKNVPAYRRLAKKAAKIWMELGALEYRECIGDDLSPKMPATFPKTLRAGRGDTVIFSWIVYRSKAHRDRVNARVMKDPRMLAMMDPENNPFDVERMLYGGFRVMVEAIR